MLKRCTVCKDEKPITEFHKRAYSKSGLSFRCKTCNKRTSKKHYYENKEKHAKYKRNYFKTKKGREKLLLASRRMMIKYPEKWEARYKLRSAVRKGEIVKPTICEAAPRGLRVDFSDCTGRIEAHHYLGYDGENWKYVLWLCVKHHSEQHRNLKK